MDGWMDGWNGRWIVRRGDVNSVLTTQKTSIKQPVKRVGWKCKGYQHHVMAVETHENRRWMNGRRCGREAERTENRTDGRTEGGTDGG